ncbi:hypothetical protein METBIDRAFT_219964 [Metschnikowia bicuspidata var. bicuspidata NRRL YB-4993]|uniref:Uncharacterized protein n=1 Tax=Metschnikowia bicuspidata var. bicuspidata NRRL YB-4993 TaxID=869754 RepID=A0A1A0H579_9ASCO|nr:hypothetical protein METBIDRAFT_219964 [Metschnikowia bicuspidata var. bicuspidata NRRL YB-4993]OBA19191.1 hypothetical protein METBIDRAFT_219964 [Metschnikowia bicuspidata var. bicuspidata NRRL YB-4993]
MDPGAVVIKFNPERWSEIHAGEASDSQSRIVSFSYTKGSGPQDSERPSHVLPTPRKRHLRPLSASSFERPVHESLHNLAQYSQIMEKGAKPAAEVDTDWYDDLSNVGQRLRFLRDTFKVLQSVRKRKMMGERADFRTLYEARVSRTGSPQLLDEDLRAAPFSDDENAANWAAVPAAPVNRRGRPRKRRGRERKAPLGRAEAAVKRTRASRRVLEAPLPAPEQNPSVSPPAPVRRRRGRPRASEKNPPLPTSETQGPRLMHLPPILPSQRLSLVQGIPPYRHIMAGGVQAASGTNPPFLPSTAALVPPAPSAHTGKLNTTQPFLSSSTEPEHVATMGKPTTTPPFLPSQSAFPAPQYNASTGVPSGYLPSQLLLQGVIPFQFQNYPLAANSTLSTGMSGQTGYSLGYRPPLNFANFKEATYSAGKPANGEMSWGKKLSVGAQPGSSGITKSQFPVPLQAALLYKPNEPSSASVNKANTSADVPPMLAQTTPNTPKPMTAAIAPKSGNTNLLPPANIMHSSNSSINSAHSYPSAHPGKETSSVPPKLSFLSSTTSQGAAVRPQLSYLSTPTQQPGVLNYQGLQNLAGLHHGSTYRPPSSQAAPLMLYSSWPAAYPDSTQLTDSLGMALPSLRALENDIKLPQPSIFGETKNAEDEKH